MQNGGTSIVTARTYDAGNRLLGLSETQGSTTLKELAFTHDNNGNRTQRWDKIPEPNPITNYAYDQADRLVGIGTYMQYAYNGDGLRMRKTQGETDTFFAWDVVGGLPLLLQDGGGSYIYGPGGLLLEEVVDGRAYFYHTDRLGSVRAVTDIDGRTANSYTYDAYGKTLTSSTEVSNPFGYTREYTDVESGFIYLRARYYDPETQQFLTVDPIVAWTEQAYAYVDGSATNATDPSGNLCLGNGVCISPGSGIQLLCEALGLCEKPKPSFLDDLMDGMNNFAYYCADYWQATFTSGVPSSYPQDYSTPRTKNWSSWANSERDARALARDKMGHAPVEISPGKFRSLNGKWQYRAKPGDVADKHIHLEELDPITGEVLQNLHIRWK